MGENTQAGMILDYPEGELMVLRVYLRAMEQNLSDESQRCVVSKLLGDVSGALRHHGDRHKAESETK